MALLRTPRPSGFYIDLFSPVRSREKRVVRSNSYSAGTYRPRRRTSAVGGDGGDGRPQPKPSSPRRNSEQKKHQAPKVYALYNPLLSTSTVPALACWHSTIASVDCDKLGAL
jgi:hypothetical protein